MSAFIFQDNTFIISRWIRSVQTFEGVRVKLILEYIFSFQSCMGTFFFFQLNKQNTKITLLFSTEKVITVPHIAIGNGILNPKQVISTQTICHLSQHKYLNTSEPIISYPTHRISSQNISLAALSASILSQK